MAFITTKIVQHNKLLKYVTGAKNKQQSLTKAKRIAP